MLQQIELVLLSWLVDEEDAEVIGVYTVKERHPSWHHKEE